MCFEKPHSFFVHLFTDEEFLGPSDGIRVVQISQMAFKTLAQGLKRTWSIILSGVALDSAKESGQVCV